MLAMAGQSIDQFMKEMEVVHRKRETERAQDLSTRLSLLNSDPKDKDSEIIESSVELNHQQHQQQQQQQQQTMPPMGIPPPPLLYRPPPPPMHLRMPPPPPPRIGLRLPPGPPPGMPRMLRPGPPSMPRMPPSQIGNLGMHSQLQGQAPGSNQQKTPNVLSAAPQLVSRKDKDGKNLTTIEAKPQIRNLAADVTRFLPSSLRVKRGDEKKKQPYSHPKIVDRIIEQPIARHHQPKDDAYMQFMHEIEGLL